MALHLIGLGLADAKDISLKGLEVLKSCDRAYLESYTSLLQSSPEELERLSGKKILPADRELVEQRSDEILDRAKEGEVAFLVVGDPMCATTHLDLRLRAKEKGIVVNVIHNASILSAIAVLGLEAYKYGKVTSIPFHHANVSTPHDVLLANRTLGLHTLFLLDLDPIHKKFLTIPEAIGYLISRGVGEGELAIACARIGAGDQLIRAGELGSLGGLDWGKAPYCLVLPGKMHFMEEEALSLWKD